VGWGDFLNTEQGLTLEPNDAPAIKRIIEVVRVLRYEKGSGFPKLFMTLTRVR
jgi:hypothetical protein